jgi:hypothetical protein
MTFENWKKEVNAKLIHFCGIPCDLFPDWDYWSAWKDGEGTTQAAVQVMEANGFMEQAGWDDEGDEDER